MDLLIPHIDFSKTPKEILFSVITKTNGYPMSTDKFSLGIPQIVNVTSPHGKLLTTAIEVAAIPGKGGRGKTIVYYNRIDLASVNANNDFLIPAGNYTKVSDLLDVINHHYGVVIAKEDILDEAVPVFSGTDPTAVLPVTLVASPYSLLFSGKTRFLIERPDIDISLLIPNQYLTDIRFDY